MTLTELQGFLAQQNLAVLATVTPDGESQSALVGIAVTPSLEIIFDTVQSSRKYGNLLAHPAASLVIGWDGEITVQYQGVAVQPTGEELARYQEIYFAKWPECRTHQSWPGITYFVVRPKWIRYSDFNLRPPQIEEFTF